jgi:hypothetical protein
VNSTHTSSWLQLPLTALISWSAPSFLYTEPMKGNLSSRRYDPSRAWMRTRCEASCE